MTKDDSKFSGEALAAQSRDELLGTYARAIAHEASNLLFLEQILATPTSAPAAGKPAPALPPEFRRALTFIRKEARLIAGTLLAGDKARVNTGASLADDWNETLVRLGGLGVPLTINFDAGARAARYRERTGLAEILLHHVALEIAAALRKVPGGPGIQVAGTAGDSGLLITVERDDHAPLPPLTTLAQNIAGRGRFRDLTEDGGGAPVQYAFSLPASDKP